MYIIFAWVDPCNFQNVVFTSQAFLSSKCMLFTCTFQFYLLIQNTCLPMYVKYFCVYIEI